MAKPSDKAPEMEKALTGMFGFDRRKVIQENHCTPEPYGCGRQIIPEVDPSRIADGTFRNGLSLKEYSISGLCQLCQDDAFSPPEE